MASYEEAVSYLRSQRVDCLVADKHFERDFRAFLAEARPEDFSIVFRAADKKGREVRVFAFVYGEYTVAARTVDRPPPSG